MYECIVNIFVLSGRPPYVLASLFPVICVPSPSRHSGIIGLINFSADLHVDLC